MEPVFLLISQWRKYRWSDGSLLEFIALLAEKTSSNSIYTLATSIVNPNYYKLVVQFN